MKIRILSAVALLLLASAPAWATVNTRQNGDGTADVVGARDTVRFGNCFGGHNIQIPVQLNSLSTTYGVSPISNGVIRGVYGVTPSATTGNAQLEVYVNQLTTPVRFFNTSNSLVSKATINFAATAAGSVRRISTTREVSGAGGMVSHTTAEGDYIAISSDGGATGLATAQVFVQVCPR